MKMMLLSNIKCLKLNKEKCMGRNERVGNIDETGQWGFMENYKVGIQPERENPDILV